MINGAGGAFSVGISGGFIYHFWKGFKNHHQILQQSSRFRCGLSAACAKAPRVGGLAALCMVGLDLSTHVVHRFNGPPVRPSIVEFAAQAMTTGAIFAHRGPRFALTAGFAFPALLLMMDGATIWLQNRRFRASSEKVNSYLSPHYRLLQRPSDGDNQKCSIQG